MTWWKIAAAYVSVFVVFVVVSLVIVETVELLIGKNERDLNRSGRWARRLVHLTDTLRGSWTLGLAWTFAVFLLVGLGAHDTPTAGDRWRMLQADAVLFVFWVLVAIVRTGVQARHAERIDMVARK